MKRNKAKWQLPHGWPRCWAGEREREREREKCVLTMSFQRGGDCVGFCLLVFVR